MTIDIHGSLVEMGLEEDEASGLIAAVRGAHLARRTMGVPTITRAFCVCGESAGGPAFGPACAALLKLSRPGTMEQAHGG